MSAQHFPKDKDANSIIAQMRARPRQTATDKSPEIKPQTEDTRLAKRLLRRLKLSKEAPKDVASADLEQKNVKLAKRLEALEDRSWEIRESEELHRSLAEAFGDIIIDRDEDGSILFTNRFADLYFGSNQALPEPQANSGTDPVTRDIEVSTQRGKRWLSWTDIALRDDASGRRHIRSVGRDITERKHNETQLVAALDKARIASEVKSRFLAMVSHEMRTPLNGIAGMAQLLRDTPLDPAQRSHVETIEHSGSALLALVNDLLDSAQIDAGKMQLRPEPSDLRQILEQSAEMLASRAAEKGLTISTYLDPTLPQKILVDSARLRQLLLNLGGNAVKFTRRGGVSIEMTGSVKDLTASVTITVIDSGPGISKADQSRIFEEFEQTAAGPTRKHDGAGLGLFIAQKIATLMGSSIKISSVEGRGSRFYLTFESEIVTDAHTEPPRPELSNIRIALVMAQSPARSALSKTLRSIAKSAVVFDGTEGFQVQSDSNSGFDVVLTSREAFRDFENLQNECRQDAARWIVVDHPSSRSVSAETTPKTGWLTWPVRLSSLRAVLSDSLQPEQRSASKPPNKKTPKTTKRALLVEDNQINTLVARNFLEKEGFDVDHAEDGHAAMDLFEDAMTDSAFDVVLLDLNMPGLDGWSVLSRIRELDNDQTSGRTRVIVLSADDQPQTRDAVIEQGADFFLAKPFDFDVLTDLLNAPLAA